MAAAMNEIQCTALPLRLTYYPTVRPTLSVFPPWAGRLLMATGMRTCWSSTVSATWTAATTTTTTMATTTATTTVQQWGQPRLSLVFVEARVRKQRGRPSPGLVPTDAQETVKRRNEHGHVHRAANGVPYIFLSAIPPPSFAGL